MLIHRIVLIPVGVVLQLLHLDTTFAFTTVTTTKSDHAAAVPPQVFERYSRITTMMGNKNNHEKGGEETVYRYHIRKYQYNHNHNTSSNKRHNSRLWMTSSSSASYFQSPTVDATEYSRLYRQWDSNMKDHTYWVKHRSSMRLLRHLQTMPKSIIYRTIQPPVWTIAKLTTAIVLWNFVSILSQFYHRTVTYSSSSFVSLLFGLGSKLPLLHIPMDQLVMTSPMLGLLLVLRINSCYKRWEEAITNWTKTKNQSRNIMRMAQCMRTTTTTTAGSMEQQQPQSSQFRAIQRQQQQSELQHLGICLWTYARSMKRQLTPTDDDEISYLNEIYSCRQLPKSYKDQLVGGQVQHRPNCALQYLSYAIEHLSGIPNMRKNEIHNAVTIFEQCLGSNERILSSPVPVFYTRLTEQFLFLWLAFCPLALYTHVINTKLALSSTTLLSTMLMFGRSLTLIPMMYMISMFLFGIDEIAMQCEEPFSILPQQEYCNEIYNDCMEIANYNYYDNDDDDDDDTNSNESSNDANDIDTDNGVAAIGGDLESTGNHRQAERTVVVDTGEASTEQQHQQSKTAVNR